MQNVLTIRGGYNTRGGAAQSIQYKDGDTTLTFVELDKNSEWFLKGVGGLNIQKGDLKSVQVMQLIREWFCNKAMVADTDEADILNLPEVPAVAEGHNVGSKRVDPMDECDEDTPPATRPDTPPAKRPKLAIEPKKKPKIEASRAMILALQVPTRPRCADCAHDGTTTIRVYRRPKNQKKSDGNLYLCTDSLDWLLEYAADELAFQGVEREEPPATCSQDGNCDAVAGLYLEWQFSDKAWEGTFVTGPLKGRSKRFSVQDLDGKMWAKLRDEAVVDGYVSRTSNVARMNALKTLTTMWGATVARNKPEELRQFEERWCSQKPGPLWITPRPPRRRQKAVDDFDVFSRAVAHEEEDCAAEEEDDAVATSLFCEGEDDFA